jgi:hypothetical protein
MKQSSERREVAQATTRGNSGAKPGASFQRTAARLTPGGVGGAGAAAGVEAHVLRLDGKAVTPAVFQQIEERNIFCTGSRVLILRGEPLGPVCHAWENTWVWESFYLLWRDRGGRRLFRMPACRAEDLGRDCPFVRGHTVWACPDCVRDPSYVLPSGDGCDECGRRCQSVPVPRWVPRGYLFFAWLTLADVWVMREDGAYNQEAYAAVVSRLRQFEEMPQVFIEA